MKRREHDRRNHDPNVLYGSSCGIMTTKLQIISRLWSHITDLRLILRGTSSKTLEEIENEIDITENLCRPYADADDEEAFK